MFMTREDWLVGRDRGSEAADRIYAAASELVSREGFEALTIEALAAEVHCSPATIYRHAGGKAAIREAVTMRTSSRIVGLVREAIKGLQGTERVVTAVLVALEHIRAEPLGDLADWLTPYERFWRGRLVALGGVLDRMDDDHPPDTKDEER